jgi:LacI family transcriptional regulator, galactose operon repressor
VINVQPITKAEILEEYIIKEVLPKYKPDTKIPSERIMAKELNTSCTTIHKIFSNLTAKGILYRENGLGTFVSKPLEESPKTKIITAVCSSNTWHDHSQDASWFNSQFFLEGFSNAMRDHDYMLNILYMHPDAQSFDKGLQMMLATKADGFIFPDLSYIFPRLGSYEHYIAKLMEQGKPCMVRSADHFLSCHSIRGLLTNGLYDATNYLLKNGKKKIAFLGHKEAGDSYIDRKLDGIFLAMKEHNISEDKLSRIFVKTGFEMDGYHAVTKFLAENKDIDAILSACDRLAFGALEAVKNTGMRIPEDIAIIGEDDLARCKSMSPSMASITYPFYEMGEMVFKVMDEALNNPKMELVHQDIKCEFIPRESC